MLVHERLHSKVKGNVLFVYDSVTRHPIVNRQINVTNVDLLFICLLVLYLLITFLFVSLILYLKKKRQIKINKIQIIQPCLL